MAGVSLKPSDAQAGGGFLDDVDCVIKQMRFRLWDYNGAIQTPVLGLDVQFADPETGELLHQHPQVYSAGDAKHFVPSEDNRQAVPVGNKTGLNEGTNAMLLLGSLVNSGFPEDKIGDDVGVFDGTLVHVNLIPAPKRAGLPEPAKTADGKPKTVLVVTKILRLPWEAKAAGTTAKKAAAPKVATGASASASKATPATPAAAPSADLDAKTAGIVLGILSAKGGSIAKTAIAQAAFQACATDPDRNAIVQLAFRDDFLSADGRPWTFDGTTVKLG